MHIREARPGEKCDECGKPAVLVIVADYAEKETGYVDEVAFCEECSILELRGKRQ